MKTKKHCKDLKCPKCEGEMRRIERPGPGRNINNEVPKSVGVPRDLPLAPIDMTWDVAAAKESLKKWASSDGSGSKDKIIWSKYKKGFAYFDSNDTENFSAYKLQIVNIIDGSINVVWNAVKAVMAVLNGARGEINISDTDRKAAYSLIKAYYKKFGKEPPDLRSFFDLVKNRDELFRAMSNYYKELEVLREEAAKRKQRNEQFTGSWSSVDNTTEDHSDDSELYETILEDNEDGKKQEPKADNPTLLLGKYDAEAVEELTEELRKLSETLRGFNK